MKLKILVLALGLTLGSCSKSDTPDVAVPTSTPPTSTITLPVLTTNFSFTAQFSATPSGGGNVTADGGAPVTARGIVWATSQNPTIANSKTTNGTGLGSFVSTMTGLAINTKYYVRAYATNSSGTAYGIQTSITTVNFNLDNSPANMTADIEGTAYNYLDPNLYGFTNNDVIVLNTGGSASEPRYLWMQGNNEDITSNTFPSSNYREIDLYIPSTKFAVGSYNLISKQNLTTSTTCQAEMGTGLHYITVTSGTLAVTEYNLTTKRIKGTFSFAYTKTLKSTGTPVSGSFQVTNGTFNYALDDSYFN